MFDIRFGNVLEVFSFRDKHALIALKEHAQITPLIASSCNDKDELPCYLFLGIFEQLKYHRDTPEDANASKDFHQGFLLCASEASLLS